MAVLGIAYIGFQVADVEAYTDQLRSAFGFTALDTGTGTTGGRPGPIKLGLGEIVLALSEAVPGDPDEQYVRRHGDGVSVIALSCDDPAADYARAVESGADVVRAADRTIAGFGDTALRFVEHRPGHNGRDGATEQLAYLIDHVALCVPAGELKDTVRFCEQALGFTRTFAEYVSVGDQGMDSVVVQSRSGAVTFTLLEPDTSRTAGQIDAFLAAHAGPGVQHLALRTDDIARAVRTLSARGVEFLSTPGTYYETLAERLDESGVPLETLRDLNILVDQDHGGQLFQIFTRSTHARGTFFFELVERRGAAGFGTSNIKALYEAVERQRSAANG